MKKETIAVLFGGISTEHEISVITALQAIQALDSQRFHIIPVYISSKGVWYTGKQLMDRAFYRQLPAGLSILSQVTLLPDPSIQGLVPIENGQALIRKKIKIDACLMAFHGQYGEDGAVQGLLELADIPYTGSGVLGAALAMNKHRSKMLLSSYNIPVLPGIFIHRHQIIASLADTLKCIFATPGLEAFPLFVKPCNLGSSVGISIANNEAELSAALAKAFQYDSEALVEPCITDLMEINVSVLDGTPPIASVVEIPIATGKLLSYEDKYLRGGKGSKSASRTEGMASLTRMIDPADLDPEIKNMVSKYAVTSFQALRCSGVVRIDFIYDKRTEKLYFNELNSIPGSLSFYLWEKTSQGMLYTELLNSIIDTAIAKKQQKLSLEKTIPFKALK